MTNLSNRLRSVGSFPRYVVWNNVFSDDEVKRVVEFCSANQLEKGAIVDGNDSPRKSNIGFFHFSAETEWVFDKLNPVIEKINRDYYGFDLLGYDHFQYSEYSSATEGKYDFHLDLIFDQAQSGRLMRKLTIVLPLSEAGDDFDGGRFEITQGGESSAETVELKKGSLIAFPSFLMHRVTTVNRGVRKSLVVWVEGQSFR